MVFVFDRYIEGRKMAEGARINHASTLVEALEKAFALFRPGAAPGEIERTAFVLRHVKPATDR